MAAGQTDKCNALTINKYYILNTVRGNLGPPVQSGAGLYARKKP